MNFRKLCTSRFFNLLFVFPLLLSLSFTPATSPAEAQARFENAVPIGAALSGLSALSDSVFQSAALNFTQIAAGGAHTCGLVAGGVKCWGDNTYGQLGDGTTTTPRIMPVDVNGLGSGSGVTAVATGGTHTCALVAGGVSCWGANAYGQLGDGTTLTQTAPVAMSGLGIAVTAVAAGLEHTCVVLIDGGVKCWGRNDSGQLGNGTTNSSSTPVAVSGLGSGVTAVAAGRTHTCALLAGGALKCWGANSDGQLGNSTVGFDAISAIPVAVTGLGSGVTAVALAGSHTCALVAGGVKCWGRNDYGQLGTGTTSVDRYEPVDVVGLGSGVTAIAAGYEHTCALVAGGGVKCWGKNYSGQLGDGTANANSYSNADPNRTVYRTMPVDVIGLGSGVTAVTAGGSVVTNLSPGYSYYGHTCALVAGGGVKCWGDNTYGQLGDGTSLTHTTPVNVLGLGSGVTAVATGGAHTCALMAAGVKCWGDNTRGQLGDGTKTIRSTPVDVNGLGSGSGVTAVAAGGSHTCALMAGGVKCWGDNTYGQLGDGTSGFGVYSAIPVDVNGLGSGSGVTAVSTGEAHTCAVVAGGGVKCWGYNWEGQLGNGTADDGPHPIPEAVSGLGSGVKAVAAGSRHTCAVLTDGSVKCWGRNMEGQLGNNTGIYGSPVPVDVVGLGGPVTAVALSEFKTCVLMESGEVKNLYYAGFGTSLLGSGVTAITAGASHFCALQAGGVKCWGNNTYGQLGDGTTTNPSTPVDVIGLGGGVTAVAAGGSHTCALVAGGVQCWGHNRAGQLGVNPGWTPVRVVGSFPPQLTINYSTGKPGSYFTLTGWGFPFSSTVTITVNSYVFTVTVPADATGSFIFFINTTNADEGSYTVTASVISGGGAHALSEAAASANSSASAVFMLIAGAPLRLQSGDGQTLAVPAGIAVPLRSLFLPLVIR